MNLSLEQPHEHSTLNSHYGSPPRYNRGNMPKADKWLLQIMTCRYNSNPKLDDPILYVRTPCDMFKPLRDSNLCQPTVAVQTKKSLNHSENLFNALSLVIDKSGNQPNFLVEKYFYLKDPSKTPHDTVPFMVNVWKPAGVFHTSPACPRKALESAEGSQHSCNRKCKDRQTRSSGVPRRSWIEDSRGANKKYTKINVFQRRRAHNCGDI